MFIKKKGNKWKGNTSKEEEEEEQTYGMPYFIKELKGFGMHATVYGLVLLVLAFALDLRNYEDIVISRRY
jgi:hypothetical protein